MQETLNLGETPFSSGRFSWCQGSSGAPLSKPQTFRGLLGRAKSWRSDTATFRKVRTNHFLQAPYIEIERSHQKNITWTLVCHGASPSSIVMVGLHSCSREALLTLLWKVTTFGLYGFWRVSEGWYVILEILSTSFYIYVGMVWVFKHVQLSLAFGSQKFGCQISDSRDCLRDRKRCPPPISTPQILHGRNEQIQCHIIPLGSPGFLPCSLVKSCGAPMKTIPVTPRAPGSHRGREKVTLLLQAYARPPPKTIPWDFDQVSGNRRHPETGDWMILWIEAD